ncbi:MAG: DivIVA domain-containing protein [Balneolaceae bacterium]
MKLTAIEIKQQTFDKSIRGYDPAEVQAFLNLTANEWEHLVARNKELEEQIEKLNDKLKHYERVESALHETLQTAKESAEQKLKSAKKDSRNIIEKAEMEADHVVREANQQRQQIRQSILGLLDRRKEIIGGIRSYLEMARESLGKFTDDEAGLFDIPAKEMADSGEHRQTSPPAGPDKEKRDGKPPEAGKPPSPSDTEDMDDILDEID